MASDRLVGQAYSSGGQFHRYGLPARLTLPERRLFQLASDRPHGQRSDISSCPRLRLLDELPHSRWREGQFTRLDPQRRKRVRDGVGDHATDRNNAALARALGPERIVRRGLSSSAIAPDIGKASAVGIR